MYTKFDFDKKKKKKKISTENVVDPSAFHCIIADYLSCESYKVGTNADSHQSCDDLLHSVLFHYRLLVGTPSYPVL